MQVECVPNFSEGRRSEVVAQLQAAVKQEASVRLLDTQVDASHNRCVLTLAGPTEGVGHAAFRAARVARDLIDLNHHSGEHPRIGAVDVIPFVPLAGTSMEKCVRLAKSVGERIARELGVPVYLYEEAATRPERKNLANIREGQFEGLREAVKKDAAKIPDFGPPELHPTAGAVAVGARWPLIAYNIDLETKDVKLAKQIAKAIRERDGGLPGIKALGMFIEERRCAQVSMNVCNYRATSLKAVYDRVMQLAVSAGVEVRSSEIVGLVPEDALPDAWVAELKLSTFTPSQVIDRRLQEVV